MIARFLYAAYVFPSWTCRIDRDPDGTAEGKQVLVTVASPRDQTSHPHPISSMVTKICHHAAVVYVRATRW
jgi:hypothetical protein